MEVGGGCGVKVSKRYDMNRADESVERKLFLCIPPPPPTHPPPQTHTFFNVPLTDFPPLLSFVLSFSKRWQAL